jgi:hypothetical protein
LRSAGQQLLHGWWHQAHDAAVNSTCSSRRFLCVSSAGQQLHQQRDVHGKHDNFTVTWFQLLQARQRLTVPRRQQQKQQQSHALNLKAAWFAQTTRPFAWPQARMEHLHNNL